MVIETDMCDLQGMMTGFIYDDFTNHQDVMKDHKMFGEQPNGDAPEYSEIFSDLCLEYINKILNEEDINEKLDMFQGHPALEATEKCFSEILGEDYLSSPSQESLYNNVSPETSDGSDNVNSCITSDVGASEFSSPQNYPVSTDYSLSSVFNVSEGLEEPEMSQLGARDLLVKLPELQFLRGVEEARKFLPREKKLVIDLEADDFLLPRESKHNGQVEVEVEVEVENQERDYPNYGSRGRKNRHSDELGLEEGRNNKQSAVDYTEETLRSEMFDLVLLDRECKGAKGAPSLQGAISNEATKSVQGSRSRGSGGRKGRGKMQSKSEAVDLTTLLIHCAQAVSTDDWRNANELLKQIRQHASPFGNGTQRLALLFADGLEARMAGTGSETYRSLHAKPVTAIEILMAYKLYIAACPFKKVSYCFSSQMILKATERASAVHIVDFGIYLGFQWPSFFESIARRHGGPPKIRITGIELPQTGLRPAEKLEETGRRLAEYARSFNVPFEYHAIAAARWETVRIEDLNINKEEVLVVNCLFRLKYLADETEEEVDCPRDKVLNMIRKLNPAIFIHGIMNGSYNAPFFLTRFKQALFHFSAMYDMLEATISREDPQRMYIEKCLFDRDALNLIACEGADRVERPETYKQWQVRNLRAGFVQLPLDRDIMKKATAIVRPCYHKDFVIDEDGRWLIQGWKGRILYALSAWRPNNV